MIDDQDYYTGVMKYSSKIHLEKESGEITFS